VGDAFYRDVVAALGVGVVVTDPDLRITACNRRAAELLGADPAGLVGRRFLDGDLDPIGADGEPVARRQLPPAAVAGPGRAGEEAVVGILGRDGDRRWLLLRSAPLPGRWRRAVAGAVSWLEQTDGHRDLASGSELSAVVEASGDAILVKTLQGTITSWNSGAERIYGYRAEEAVGRPVSMLLPPDRPDEVSLLVARLARGERVEHLETRRLRKDGTVVEVSLSASPILDDRGRVVGASTVARDITEARAAEAALDRSNKWFEALVQRSHEVIAVMGPLGGISYVTPSVQAVLGYHPEEIVSDVGLDFVHADSAPAVHSLLSSVIAEPGSHEQAEVRGVRADGSDCWLEFGATNLLDEPAIGGVVVNLRDVTERREGAEERARLRERVQQSERLESLGQLAGGVAHDFNNLLSVILNYARFVTDSLDAGSRQRDDVKEIITAAERAADLTRQLLIFGRRGLVRSEIIDLNDVVSEVEHLLRRTIGENVTLALALSGDLWSVRADRSRLEQVVVNLVVNGRDAMPQGGRVVVTTSNEMIDEEYVARHPEAVVGPHVCLTVTDTGEGMPKEVSERAFEPFFTTKATGQGTGLGLATVYGAVVASGGQVALYSELGRGTTVRVLLPATREAGPAPASAEERRRRTGEGEVVLLVEDEEAVREMAERILSSNGYAVRATGRPREALQLLTAGDARVDLLLSDVVMPGMSGPELAERARRLRPGLHVLFMSGYPRPVIDQGETKESLFLVEKPFTSPELLGAVRDALDRGGTPG
jgi:two-component system cell cycle sensor histidine kinase/response regulator CckA